VELVLVIMILFCRRQLNVVLRKLFHKIKQRPGKPLYFGKKENKLVFGLPGNPSSVLTCFYQYVIPALEKLSKRRNWFANYKSSLAKTFQKIRASLIFSKVFIMVKQ
jgi:molybdopterin molybdotransferase